MTILQYFAKSIDRNRKEGLKIIWPQIYDLICQMVYHVSAHTRKYGERIGDWHVNIPNVVHHFIGELILYASSIFRSDLWPKYRDKIM